VVFDFDTWEEVKTLKGGDGCVLTLALSADDTTLVSSGHGGAIRVWDTGKLVLKSEFTPLPNTCVRQLDLTANGKEVVAIHFICGNPIPNLPETLRVWGSKDGEKLDGWGAGHLYQQAGFLPDGRVVQSTFTGSVVIWTGRGEGAIAEYLSGHEKGDLTFAVTRRGRRLLSHDGTGKARWWDLTNLKAEPLTLETGLKGGRVSIDPTGKLAAVAHDGEIAILKLPDK
jgi:WD40 repeat protein